MQEPDAKALQNVTRNLFAAFQNFFAGLKDKKRKVGYPRFKSKRSKQSYKTNNINGNIKVDFARKKLKLPKLAAWIAYRDNRVFTEPIQSFTVSKTKSGKYFASILIARELHVKPKQIIQEENLAAFDMSFASFLVSEHGKSHFWRSSKTRGAPVAEGRSHSLEAMAVQILYPKTYFAKSRHSNTANELKAKNNYLRLIISWNGFKS